MAKLNALALLCHRPIPRPPVFLPQTLSASTHQGQHADRSSDQALGMQVRRFMPSDAKDFLDFRTGALQTTPEIHGFLSRTGISYDSGLMYRLRDPVVAKLARKFEALIYYSPGYVMHPHHVLYLTPRCHPMALEMCSRYEIKMREMPLWINSTSYGTEKPVVRTTAKRRLKGAVHRALLKMGYDDNGRGRGKVIKGTLGIHIHRPLTGIDEDSEEFGRAMAKAVESESRRIFGNGI